MGKLRFGVDIDGTVTDPGTFVPYINEHFNKTYTIDDITEYDLSKVLGITEKDFWEWMKSHEPTIYKQSALATDAKNILEEWQQFHELYYISARGKHFHDLTVDWFHRLQVPYDHIELLGKHDKLNAVKKHGVHLFLEDKHDNACDIAEECKIPVILMDTPYNQSPIPKDVYRVKSWNEAKAIVKKLF